jgi:hypothetical protein
MWAHKEVNANTGDFIYNEVVTWLMEQMKTAGPKFTFEQGDKYLHFENSGGIRIGCEKEHSHFGSGWHVSFKIDRDKIFEYVVNTGSFNHKEAWKAVFQSGQYKDYAISGGVEVKPKSYRSVEFKDFKDLKLKKQLWQAHIKSGDYLKRSVDIQWVTKGYGENLPQLTYKEVVELPKTIIKAFKTSILYRSFIKGESLEKLKKKLVGRAAKGGLTVENVVNFLEATPVKYEATHYDRGGPWATTGTDEGIHNFDITKLQKAYPETNKFLMDHAEEIFKGLQKKKFAHPLGYYTFKKAGISGNKFQLLVSCTTYYN